MSNHVNTKLLEDAAECIDYFENELPARLIERDMQDNDWEALQYHVNQALAEMAIQEQNGV